MFYYLTKAGNPNVSFTYPSLIGTRIHIQSNAIPVSFDVSACEIVNRYFLPVRLIVKTMTSGAVDR